MDVVSQAARFPVALRPAKGAVQSVAPLVGTSRLSLAKSSNRFGQSTWSLSRRGSQRLAVRMSAPSTPAAEKTLSLKDRKPEDVTVAVFGPTGYIGKFVTLEMVKRGYNVIAVSRERSGIKGRWGPDDTKQLLNGADVVFADVTDPASLTNVLKDRNVDVIVSCLASRTGGRKDSWLIDYTATKNTLEAGKNVGASHFVLLSAICVQKPLLEFQRAKLKLEAELQDQKDLTYSIVRPTAFFKSLGGQVESVKKGGPFAIFGDGKICACKPISEADLASFMADCITDEDKVNKVLPIGGPGEALTALEQGQLLFDVLGKEPKFFSVPVFIFDLIIGLLELLAKLFNSLEDAAEFAKIGRYYATESMLVLDPVTGKYDGEATPGYGKDTLRDFYARVAEEGMAGQELGDAAVF